MSLYFKSGFIGEMGSCTFLSVAKEKYQKNRHVRKGPRSFPYGSYPLSRAAFLPGGKKALCAMTSRVAGCPQPRRSAELAGLAYSRGCATSFLVLLRASGEMSADGAPPFVRALCCPRPSAHSDPFAPPWAKGSRGDGGFLKGGRASLTWRSFGTFLSTGREKYTDYTPR